MRSLAPLMVPGCLVSDHLDMVIPWTGWDFKITNDSRRGAVVLRTKPRESQGGAAGAVEGGMELKGGLYASTMPDGNPVVVFVGSLRWV